MSDTTDDRPQRIYASLNSAGLGKSFNELMTYRDDPTYLGTAYYLIDCYLKDVNNRKKYKQALKNLSECEMAERSKAAIYYLLYKIEQQNQNSTEANAYLNKCKHTDSDMYEVFIEGDKNYNLDSLQYMNN